VFRNLALGVPLQIYIHCLLVGKESPFVVLRADQQSKSGGEEDGGAEEKEPPHSKIHVHGHITKDFGHQEAAAPQIRLAKYLLAHSSSRY
jgi:hypothetical protein